MISLGINYPSEVIRNGLQSSRSYDKENLGVIKFARKIYDNRGIKGFYSGYNIALIRVLPNNAIMFISYEFCTRFFGKYIKTSY